MRNALEMYTGGEVSVGQLAACLPACLPNDRRFVLGIAGPPAAGKSTLAAGLVAALNAGGGEPAAVAPMDGFHLTSAALAATGSLHRKGEPDTFDVAGFVARLAALRAAPSGSPVSWPTFDRVLDDPVPDGVVFTTQRIAVVEGNYLLLDEPGWREARGFLDTVWYLDATDAVLEPRLRDRHLAGGKSAAETENKIAHSDLPNARTIAGSRPRADVYLRERGGSYLMEKFRRMRHPAPHPGERFPA